MLSCVTVGAPLFELCKQRQDCAPRNMKKESHLTGRQFVREQCLVCSTRIYNWTTYTLTSAEASGEPLACNITSRDTADFPRLFN